MRRLTRCTCVALLCLPPLARAQSPAPGAITIGRLDSVWSPTLKEHRPIWIHTPPSYRDTLHTPQRYPVLYLLDGDAHFHSVTGLLHILGTGVNGTYVVPEMTLGIPTTRPDAPRQPGPMSGALRGRVYYYSYRVTAEHALAEYDAALKSALRGRAQYPSHPLTIVYSADAWTYLGRRDKVLPLLDSLAAVPADQLRTAEAVTTLAIGDLYEARAHGHRDLETSIAAWLDNHAPRSGDRRGAVQRLSVNAALGRWDRVIPLADSLLPTDSVASSALQWRGVAAAMTGDTRTAQLMARRLDTIIAASQTSTSAMLGPRVRDFLLEQRATIAAALDEPDRAVAFLRTTGRAGWNFNTHHTRPIHEMLRSYPPYQALIKPRG